MRSSLVLELLNEIVDEQQISPFVNLESIKNLINEAIFFLDGVAHVSIDYEVDLNARSLLKSYVLYANHKRLAEWKELYQNDYIKIQEYYYVNPKLS